MKKYKGIRFFITILLGVLLLFTCKSDPECGCEGKKAFDVTEEIGYITYSVEVDYAQFQSLAMGTYFVLCNPHEFRDSLATFDQGDLVIVTGKAHNQCYNNPYGPVSFHLTMATIEKYKIDD